VDVFLEQTGAEARIFKGFDTECVWSGAFLMPPLTIADALRARRRLKASTRGSSLFSRVSVHVTGTEIYRSTTAHFTRHL
jgi:hypothetical protein